MRSPQLPARRTGLTILAASVVLTTCLSAAAIPAAHAAVPGCAQVAVTITCANGIPVGQVLQVPAAQNITQIIILGPILGSLQSTSTIAQTVTVTVPTGSHPAIGPTNGTDGTVTLNGQGITLTATGSPGRNGNDGTINLNRAAANLNGGSVATGIAGAGNSGTVTGTGTVDARGGTVGSVNRGSGGAGLADGSKVTASKVTATGGVGSTVGGDGITGSGTVVTAPIVTATGGNGGTRFEGGTDPTALIGGAGGRGIGGAQVEATTITARGGGGGSGYNGGAGGGGIGGAQVRATTITAGGGDGGSGSGVGGVGGPGIAVGTRVEATTATASVTAIGGRGGLLGGTGIGGAQVEATNVTATGGPASRGTGGAGISGGRVEANTVRASGGISPSSDRSAAGVVAATVQGVGTNDRITAVGQGGSVAVLNAKVTSSTANSTHVITTQGGNGGTLTGGPGINNLTVNGTNAAGAVIDGYSQNGGRGSIIVTGPNNGTIKNTTGYTVCRTGGSPTNNC
ncbi:hypothetical protein ACFW2T_12340 [Streptomyces sp. NPDC058892]|uniref:hypothetical protein n=1 Tax=unclassified Streptomyces TaxID=2593676 RepID=UPI0036A274AB